MALVVIGGVAAGLSAATRARRVDPRLEILVLEKGPVVSYGACSLPYFVEGRVTKAEDLIVYTSDYFRKERNIEVRTGARVVSIAHPRRELQLESGERIRYDKLVIATGARCDAGGISGVNEPHVFTLHTIADAERIRVFLRDKRPRRAVVIGAGYIGVEAADALRRHGLHVTIVERSANALRRDDPDFTEAVRKHLEAHRVELRTNIAVKAIDDFAADMVVLAAGFKPNVAIAAEAGVQLGRTGAVATDDHMETNLRGVYAAGDCAEVLHLVTNRPAYIPLGTTANKCGRVAGANAAGARDRFAGIVGTSIVSIFGRGFATAGLSVAQAKARGFTPVAGRIEAREKSKHFQGRNTTVELVVDRPTRRLIGGSVIGEDGVGGRINVIAAALQSRLTIDDFESLDLAYTPPFAPTWDPLLIAAQAAQREL